MKTAEENFDGLIRMIAFASKFLREQNNDATMAEVMALFATQQVTAATDGWRHDYKSVKSALSTQKRINAELQKRIEGLEAQVPKWISVEEQPPINGIELLLYNEKWIDEDVNPKGIRIGYFDDVCGWVTAKWCSYHDEYHTRTSDEDDHNYEDWSLLNQIPTHWMPLPQPIK